MSSSVSDFLPRVNLPMSTFVVGKTPANEYVGVPVPSFDNPPPSQTSNANLPSFVYPRTSNASRPEEKGTSTHTTTLDP